MKRATRASLRKFYIYILFRPWNGIPCYVGKGQGNRHTHHKKAVNSNHHPNEHLINIFKKAARLNLDVPIVIIKSELSEKAAFALERCFIKAIGRMDKKEGPLVNLTDGGEGASGAIRSPEWRKAARKWLKPKNRLGCKHTPESLAKQAQSRLNRTPEQKAITAAKSSAAHKGRKPSPLAIANSVATRLNKKQTPEHIAKRTTLLRGQKRSEETKATMRRAQQANSELMSEIVNNHYKDPEFRRKQQQGSKRWANSDNGRKCLSHAGRLGAQKVNQQRRLNGDSGSTKDCCWITNGKENQLLKSEEPCPDGWHAGMTKKPFQTILGCRRITNGNENKVIPREEPLPNGWWYGSTQGGTKDLRYITNGKKNKMVRPNEPLPDNWWYGMTKKTT